MQYQAQREQCMMIIYTQMHTRYTLWDGNRKRDRKVMQQILVKDLCNKQTKSQTTF